MRETKTKANVVVAYSMTTSPAYVGTEFVKMRHGWFVKNGNSPSQFSKSQTTQFKNRKRGFRGVLGTGVLGKPIQTKAEI